MQKWIEISFDVVTENRDLEIMFTGRSEKESSAQKRIYPRKLLIEFRADNLSTTIMNSD